MTLTEYEFGTTETRLAHFAEATGSTPPELQYEEGQVQLTPDLAEYCSRERLDYDWVGATAGRYRALLVRAIQGAS